MITIVLKCSFRNYEHRITDTMKQAKCVCLPFHELSLSIQNKKQKYMLLHWLKIGFHSKMKKQFGCYLE